jgi:hypothetical protein
MNTFKLDIPKTVQAVALLLKANNRQRIEYLWLIKALYIADRESLRDFGKPISGDLTVAMVNGPVLSGVYDLVNTNLADNWLQLWKKFLHRDDYDLVLVGDPGVDQLTPNEQGKLIEVAHRHKDHTCKDMIRITHDFDEWKWNQPDSDRGILVRRIPVEDVVKAVGRGDDLPWIFEDARAATALDNLIANRA